MSAKKRRNRRHRRQQKMSNRGKFKINHKRKTGRTGSIRKKQLKAMKTEREKRP